MKLPLLKLTPYHSDKIWGWEKWTLSCHPNGLSTVTGGRFDQIPLKQVIQNLDPDLAADFPILVKIIQANQALSIQVHPNDHYARRQANTFGKSECWYILEAEPESELIINFKNQINRETLLNMIQNQTLESRVNRIKVKKGDFFYIPAGTVHAIGSGIKLLEVQQNSDVTYRVYDYDRGRKLHIQESLEVTDYLNSHRYEQINPLIKYSTPYFGIERIAIQGREKKEIFSSHKLVHLTVIQGMVTVETDHQEVILKKNESCYLSNQNYQIINLEREATSEIIQATV